MIGSRQSLTCLSPMPSGAEDESEVVIVLAKRINKLTIHIRDGPDESDHDDEDDRADPPEPDREPGGSKPDRERQCRATAVTTGQRCRYTTANRWMRRWIVGTGRCRPHQDFTNDFPA